MSARDRLYTAIEEPGVYEDPRDIHDLIDDYAHELAEEIREIDTDPNTQFAADAIDPYLNSAGPVRPGGGPTT